MIGYFPLSATNPSPDMYLTSSIQDNSRKRHSSGLDLANGHPTKRFKIDTTYNAFTDEQHAVIENTASYFQIHPSDLAAAIGSLRKSSLPPPYQHRPSYPDCFQHSYVSSDSEDSFGSQPAMTSDWHSAINSSRDRTFGFNVLPATSWSTCFSDMLAEEESVVPFTVPQPTYTGTTFAQSSPEGLASSVCQYDSVLSKQSDVPFRCSSSAGMNFQSSNGALNVPEDSSMVRVQIHILAEF